MQKKRIANIINPKGIESERLERMEARILRGVDQGIDSVKDQIADLQERSEKLIDSLGGATAKADGTVKLQDVLNKYCENEENIAVLNHYVKHLEGLKAKLNETVDITPAPVVQVEITKPEA